jgi:hypothetical protein
MFTFLLLLHGAALSLLITSTSFARGQSRSLELKIKAFLLSFGAPLIFCFLFLDFIDNSRAAFIFASATVASLITIWHRGTKYLIRFEVIGSELHVESIDFGSISRERYMLSDITDIAMPDQKWWAAVPGRLYILHNGHWIGFELIDHKSKADTLQLLDLTSE